MKRHGWVLLITALALVAGSCSSPRSASAPEASPSATPPPPPPPPTAATPAEQPKSSETAVPQFPWPPPGASARQTVPADLLAASRRIDHLGDLDAVLTDALTRTGYAEKSYWAVPRGFAIATRLEQIDANGRPKPPPARWSAEMPRLSGAFSLGAYLRALFTADPGFYRIVVFIVTDALFSESDRSVSSDEARGWVAKGLNALPESIAGLPYAPAVVCTAMIYEFERQAGSEAQPLVPSSIDAHAHLVGSGLWSALGGR